MFDLSIVTDALRNILTAALSSSPVFGGAPPPFSVAVSSESPDSLTSGADCDLNLYLFHLTESRHLRNQFWTQQSITGQPPGPPQQPIAFEPFCVDLYFLLSAQSDSSYQQEQQVMSVAVRAFHEQPIVRLATPTPTGVTPSEITLTMESPTPEDLSRLWQALGAPLRVAAQYRASVAMLEPETGATAQPKPTTWSLLAAPTDGDHSLPFLYGTVRRVFFQAPAGQRSYDQTPASAAPAPAAVAGQEFVLRGSGILSNDQVFLVTVQPDGTEVEQDVTSWKVALVHPYPAPPADGVPIGLRPPDTPPGASPPPGRYMLRLGRPAQPGWRSNSVPVSIAPWLDPSAGPLLTAGGGGLYTCTSANVPAAGVDLRLGSALLVRRNAAPNPGEWRLSGSTITFKAPPGLPSGQYAVHLRAADVEADPALWAVVP
jgi:hypothetical protein